MNETDSKVFFELLKIGLLEKVCYSLCGKFNMLG